MKNIGHNKPPLSSREIIEKNIERKRPILDREPQFYDNVPLPSWIELSLIDVCNRKCNFCPKSDDSIAPDTFNKMEIALVKKLIKDLDKINFKGAFSISGYGEPLLHNDLINIIKLLSANWAVEIVTNGDPLNEKNLKDLHGTNLSKIVVSLYDGKHQKLKFNNMINNLNISEDFLIMRERWIKGEEFDIYKTNRAGTLKNNGQFNLDKHIKNKCFYTAYHAQIDWNGDLYLCPHDWQRRVSMGNVMQKDFFEIWSSGNYNNYRKNLFQGNRNLSPCNNCDAIGTVHGKIHSEKWNKIFDK
jgi:radical SAM protein with 4Fe4S-binding SPASM domain